MDEQLKRPVFTPSIISLCVYQGKDYSLYDHDQEKSVQFVVLSSSRFS
jgi:hypothetical protein